MSSLFPIYWNLLHPSVLVLQTPCLCNCAFYISERDRRRAWQSFKIRGAECLQSAAVVFECQLQQSVQRTGNVGFKR